ncbi:MAG: acyl-CoA dehydrogenase family protein [Nitrospirota bacterium]|nr:acyl-CoA dehydrogenase family protein [Nitrospirota bacterium]
MKTYRFDVVIIGAGPAGVAAAGALAGTGISVALIEAAAYAGAENWSGCVYFTESLAERDCFGPAAVQDAPYERQVVRRGTLVHNGVDEIGLALTDPAAFRHCYTVLRPLYDPYFADLARQKGAMLLTGTTVTSLVRRHGRVIGVATSRGIVHADVVFLAEGDAAHLVRSERMERVKEPHYLQGVKAVLSLAPQEIEDRFGLRPGEGAAYEILIRNASIAGRTAKLNVGGFLYTNRDSLSLGYVVPLDNLKRYYRGDHSLLFEWMRSLPHIADLAAGGQLSAYGTKIIRSGGWRERPVLVEDGLCVGGAATGLGIDIPFPNFTGPAAASGLYFARAVKALLKDGRSFDKRNLDNAYLRPLQASVYGRNAKYLSRWPSYFSRSSVLFGRTADMACGTARFLSAGNFTDTARFLRGHILSLRGQREIIFDNLRALTSLRLWKPLALTLMNPATAGSWIINQFRRIPDHDARLKIIINVGNARPDASALAWPFNSLVRRLSPALAQALSQIYGNNSIPMEQKLAAGTRILLRALKLTDLVVLPAWGLALTATSLAAALYDAFRYYVQKMPLEKLLAEPVMAYGAEQRKARDLDAIRPGTSLEAKLALNTSLVGSRPHIRTRWPRFIAHHGESAQIGLWWVCPARVYHYDAPLMGRGKVTVNWENCIKCESCWRAEPGYTLWGRFTDHGLVYRPESGAMEDLLRNLAQQRGTALPALPREEEEKLWYTGTRDSAAMAPVLSAMAAFRDALARVPASIDRTRFRWPLLLGERVCEKLRSLEQVFIEEGRRDAGAELKAEGAALSLRLAKGELFPALYIVERLEYRLGAWFTSSPSRISIRPEKEAEDIAQPAKELAVLFPDRMVKEWEERPLTPEETASLHRLLATLQHPVMTTVRALAAISPALALIASRQARALRVLAAAKRKPFSGASVLSAADLAITPRENSISLSGTIELAPLTGVTALILVAGTKAYHLPLSHAGVIVTPTPAIGFRAAGLSTITLDSTISADAVFDLPEGQDSDAQEYLAIALGAADYLSRRVREHAAGRVQFSGQMLDTEGRDGIAKLGAVKALVARVEAWRLLLESLYAVHSALRTPHSALDALLASLAAQAFSPEPGALGYDAGQVFGGFAYSEDDLLARYYRDSSIFRFLAPGQGSAELLLRAIGSEDLRTFLPAELGSLDRITGKPLLELAEQWSRTAASFAALRKQHGSLDHYSAGQAAALLISIRTMLSRIERDIDSGMGREADAAAADVLLGLANDALSRAAIAVSRTAVPLAAVFPLAPAGAQVRLESDYEAFCSRPAPAHRSGTYLLSLFDRSARYVPEMQLHDPRLRQRWEELASWFQKNCEERTFEGRSFERQVEHLHNLPPDIIEAVKKNRWLAATVPSSEDGLGWRKAEYYILNAAAGSFGDAGICLLIMANTSIGTTPILLGLEEELPRVAEELEPLVREPGRIEKILRALDHIVRSFGHPDPGRIRKEYAAVMALVDQRIRRTRVVKYLAANFLKAFYGAGLAGQRGDFGGFMTNLGRAAELGRSILPDVRTAYEEMPRRERCHRFHLRTLGHGGVAAFALTEPAAGSDTGGVRTTARLTTAMLSPMPDGRFAFSPTGETGKCVRYLIDADQVVFTAEGMAYRTPGGGTALINHDSLNKVRFYKYNDGVCEFHDIGQVRKLDIGLAYEYYSLTGSKMWITNGAIATQFSLYAQTPEGVTGFIVDRCAEGLIVGADERKMGQRGSPTNELALDSVRVPREAVIGYEGHGQVNALETLNVGRCGLAVVAGAIVRKVLAEADRNLPASAERDALLGEAAAILFGSESVAYYLIGLFDRAHESVRIESAIAKYLCAEDLHEILSLVERAYGPAGQTERFLLEKARRDSRILNIYEGTNEVQRFLILKDLIAMAADWPELPEALHERPDDDHARVLGRWKNRVRAHVRDVNARFKDTAWMDAMLQPALFLLPEMAGEVLRLECVLFRREWLTARVAALGKSHVDPMLAAADRATSRSLARLDHLDATFRSAWERLSVDLVTSAITAADAAMPLAPVPASVPAVHAPAGKLRVLVLLRPAAELSPRPRLHKGDFAELLWTIDPLDRSALDQAFALKEAAGSLVTVDVLLPGTERSEDLLQDHAGQADRLVRLATPYADRAMLARAIRHLEKSGAYDIIALGVESRDGDSTCAPFLANALKRQYHSLADLSVLSRTGGELLSLPAVVALCRTAGKRTAAINELIDARSTSVEVLGPAGTPLSIPGFTVPRAAASGRPIAATVKAAAEVLRDFAAAKSSETAPPYTGVIPQGPLPAGPSAWAIIDPLSGRAGTAAMRACRMAAALFGLPAYVYIAAPQDRWPGLIGSAQASGADQAFCLDTGSGTLSEEGKVQVLGMVSSASAGSAMVFSSEPWSDAMALCAREDTVLMTNATGMERLEQGVLAVSSPCFQGRLVRTEQLADRAAFVTLGNGAELPAPRPAEGFAAYALEGPAALHWTTPLAPPAPPALATAEVIIDLGYGARGKEGYDLALELKKALEDLGLEPVFGATRKVTQDLKLLPLDAQIGQTGVRVDPKLIIALGISGAPQHVDWIGDRAEVLCFNKDPQAPLMLLNQSRPGPRVHPVAGDLFTTVPELIALLKKR